MEMDELDEMWLKRLCYKCHEEVPIGEGVVLARIQFKGVDLMHEDCAKHESPTFIRQINY